MKVNDIRPWSAALVIGAAILQTAPVAHAQRVYDPETGRVYDAETGHVYEEGVQQRSYDVQIQRTYDADEAAMRAAEMRREADARPRVAFIEATGAYGIQFGVADYLPAGTPGQYRHPIVHGYAFGGTGGVMLIPGLALVANYEFQRSESRTGSLDGVLADVSGSIEFHSITIGPRLYLPIGFGALQAELAVGVVLPYETVRTLTYGPGLAAAGIQGSGSRIDNYDVAIGGHALIGYNIPLGDVLYLAVNFKLRTFQGENSGSTTELRNYANLDAQPPELLNGTVTYGNGAVRPSTNSVQDVRAQLAVGARF